MNDRSLMPVNIPYPEVSEPSLKILAGACRVRIEPVDGETWVTGTYYDPTNVIELVISQEGDTTLVRLGQSLFDTFSLVTGIPQLSLLVSKKRPFALTVDAGASGNHLELGGLPIVRLAVTHGAGNTEISFSRPNPEKMSLLKLGVGAGAVEGRGLLNANFAEMSIEDGIDSCRLDFGGVLKQDASVRVGSAMSSAEIRIPVTTAARITSANLLGAPDADEGFVEHERAYWTRAGAQGHTPVLHIHSATALGRLRLRSFEPAELVVGLATS